MKNQILITIALSFYCVTVIQSAIYGHSEILTAEEINKIVEWIRTNCSWIQNPPDFVHEKPDPDWERTIKCKLSFIYKTNKIITDDNKLIKETFESGEVVNLVPGVKSCTGTQLYEKCSNITDLDSCEYSGKLRNCLRSACGTGITLLR